MTTRQPPHTPQLTTHNLCETLLTTLPHLQILIWLSRSENPGNFGNKAFDYAQASGAGIVNRKLFLYLNIVSTEGCATSTFTHTKNIQPNA